MRSNLTRFWRYSSRNQPKEVLWTNSNHRMKLVLGPRQPRMVTTPLIADQIFKFRNRSLSPSKSMASFSARVAPERYPNTDLYREWRDTARWAKLSAPLRHARPFLLRGWPVLLLAPPTAYERPKPTSKFRNPTARCAWASRGRPVTTSWMCWRSTGRPRGSSTISLAVD